MLKHNHVILKHRTGLGDQFVSQSAGEFSAFHFLGPVLICAYTNCQDV